MDSSGITVQTQARIEEMEMEEVDLVVIGAGTCISSHPSLHSPLILTVHHDIRIVLEHSEEIR